jgi:hypothetical protein
LNPIRIAQNTLRALEVIQGGGPQTLRVRGVDPPRGLVLPSSDVHLEIKTADGRVVALDAALPLPPLYGWAYRIGRKLGLPIISTIEPEKIRFDVPVPFRR